MITALTVLLAVGAPGPGPQLGLVIAFLALGEFSIGWSNDAFDAPADRLAGRVDKPIAAGRISRRAVAVAAGGALAASLLLGFAVSVRTGVINAIGLGAGWAYNAGIKSTPASALTYLIGFGSLPPLAASTLPGQPGVHAWAYLGAALLGLGGHFADTLGDIENDQVAGVRGLPQRVAALRHGPVLVRLLAFGILLAASALILLAQHSAPAWVRLGGAALLLALAAVGLLARGKVPFVAALGIAVVNTVVLVLGTPVTIS